MRWLILLVNVLSYKLHAFLDHTNFQDTPYKGPGEFITSGWAHTHTGERVLCNILIWLPQRKCPWVSFVFVQVHIYMYIPVPALSMPHIINPTFAAHTSFAVSARDKIYNTARAEPHSPFWIPRWLGGPQGEATLFGNPLSLVWIFPVVGSTRNFSSCTVPHIFRAPAAKVLASFRPGFLFLLPALQNQSCRELAKGRTFLSPYPYLVLGKFFMFICIWGSEHARIFYLN